MLSRASPARWCRSRWASRSSSKIGPAPVSTIGMAACANAEAGRAYTLACTVADSLSYNPQLFANLPYDPDKSFVPVIRLAWTNNLLVANAKAPFNTYKEMVAYAKANPGKLNWGTWGPATLPDLYLRWISSQAGVNIQAIPYKGGAAKANTRRLFRGSRHHLHGLRRRRAADCRRHDQAAGGRG